MPGTYNPSLVKFETVDGLKLPGLLYRSGRSTRAAIYLHGNGSSSVFYDADEVNALAEALNGAGIAFFPFNNRGAHYIKTFKVERNGTPKRIKMGTTYELIKDCVKDIDAAIGFLQRQGFREFILIGISTGANKICVYNHYRPDNPVGEYVLLSGGDDTGLYYQMMGEKKFRAALAKSKSETAAGRGERMVPKYLVDYPFSYQALWDTINPDGDYNVFPYNEAMNTVHLSTKPLFHMMGEIAKPSLVMYGELDEYCYGDVPRCVETLKAHMTGKSNISYRILPGADHGFNGYEAALAQEITNWITTHDKR